MVLYKYEKFNFLIRTHAHSTHTTHAALSCSRLALLLLLSLTCLKFLTTHIKIQNIYPKNFQLPLLISHVHTHVIQPLFSSLYLHLLPLARSRGWTRGCHGSHPPPTARGWDAGSLIEFRQLRTSDQERAGVVISRTLACTHLTPISMRGIAPRVFALLAQCGR